MRLIQSVRTKIASTPEHASLIIPHSIMFSGVRASEPPKGRRFIIQISEKITEYQKKYGKVCFKLRNTENVQKITKYKAREERYRNEIVQLSGGVEQVYKDIFGPSGIRTINAPGIAYPMPLRNPSTDAETMLHANIRAKEAILRNIAKVLINSDSNLVGLRKKMDAYLAFNLFLPQSMLDEEAELIQIIQEKNSLLEQTMEDLVTEVRESGLLQNLEDMDIIALPALCTALYREIPEKHRNQLQHRDLSYVIEEDDDEIQPVVEQATTSSASTSQSLPEYDTVMSNPQDFPVEEAPAVPASSSSSSISPSSNSSSLPPSLSLGFLGARRNSVDKTRRSVVEVEDEFRSVRYSISRRTCLLSSTFMERNSGNHYDASPVEGRPLHTEWYITRESSSDDGWDVMPISSPPPSYSLLFPEEEGAVGGTTDAIASSALEEDEEEIQLDETTIL